MELWRNTKRVLEQIEDSANLPLKLHDHVKILSVAEEFELSIILRLIFHFILTLYFLYRIFFCLIFFCLICPRRCRRATKYHSRILFQPFSLLTSNSLLLLFVGIKACYSRILDICLGVLVGFFDFDMMRILSITHSFLFRLFIFSRNPVSTNDLLDSRKKFIERFCLLLSFLCIRCNYFISCSFVFFSLTLIPRKRNMSGARVIAGDITILFGHTII